MGKEQPALLIAKLAYMAYAKTTDNKNFMGNEMPRFEDLPEKIQLAWVNAVTAVIAAIKEQA
jgi:hypothetical protein